MKDPRVARRIDKALSNLVDKGYLAFDPDDAGKPWRERRLRMTALGRRYKRSLLVRDRLEAMGMVVADEEPTQ